MTNVLYCSEFCTLVCVVFFLSQVVKEVIDPQATVTYRQNTQDDPHKRKPDISKAREFLGWEPKIALRDGLKMMVEGLQAPYRGHERRWEHYPAS